MLREFVSNKTLTHHYNEQIKPQTRIKIKLPEKGNRFEQVNLPSYFHFLYFPNN